jgi:hypothetical protein
VHPRHTYRSTTADRGVARGQSEPRCLLAVWNGRNRYASWHIHGMPLTGCTGKTAVAGAVADRAYNAGVIVMSFFFSRSTMERRSPYSFVRTVSHQSARNCPPARNTIHRHIEDVGTWITDQRLRFQAQSLLIEPLNNAINGQHAMLLVIDGLDECDDL